MGEVLDTVFGKEPTAEQKWEKAQILKETLGNLKAQEKILKSKLHKSENTLKAVPDKQLADVLKPEYLKDRLEDLERKIKNAKQKLHDTPKKYRGSKPPEPE